MHNHTKMAGAPVKKNANIAIAIEYMERVISQ